MSCGRKAVSAGAGESRSELGQKPQLWGCKTSWQTGQAELVESSESLSVPAETAHNLAFTISRLSPEAFDILIGGDRSGGAISDGVGHLATELGSDVSDGIDTGDIGFHSVVGEDVAAGV
jgi:hypothetical protein